MIDASGQKDIFDRQRRRLVRDRAFVRAQGADVINKMMADAIVENLSLVKRKFEHCLISGLSASYIKQLLEQHDMEITVSDASFRLAESQNGVQCDEDRLPFADQSFDLVINAGTLDDVNDLPGALALSLRALKPDGLFLGALIGAESLPVLKSCLMEAEGEKVSPHIHPQIDIRTIGDLLARVGFKLPVVDGDTVYLRYSEMDRLINDVRDIGASNVLNRQTKALPRNIASKTDQLFSSEADEDGRTSERIELIHLCGWAPHPDQPVPARRGSGQVSLKKTLEQKN
ncbi:methyltransferase domain-containing protein [Parasphingorhabdus sp.]|uniref:methyltransferase domain-containing protein n=1 Tax=Parasphingorhabdus sp. TaxID=2709688 RepID=UPI003265FD69